MSKKIFFVIGAGLALLAATAFAQTTFTLTLHLTNPGPDAVNVVGKFTLPDCLIPQNLPAGQSWDPISRVLRAPLGPLASGETASIPIEVEVTTPQCSGNATVEGEYTYSYVTSGAGGGSQPAQHVPPTPETITPAPAEQSAAPGGASAGGPLQTLNFLPSPVANAVRSLRENPQAVAIVNQAVAPAALLASALSTIVVTGNAVAAGSHIVLGWWQTLRFIFLGFLKRKPRYPWGRVINQWTQQPIAGARVNVVEPVFKRVKETQLTDREGRFGFLVTPGAYYLTVSRAGFAPAHTEEFSVGENVAALNLTVEMVETRRILSDVRTWWVKFIHAVNDFLYQINPLVLVVGTGISAFALLVVPSTLNVIVLISYAVIDAAKAWLSLYSAKSYGLVIDQQTRLPLALSVIRIFNVDNNWLIGTRVADDRGRFTFLTLPGRYYLSCDKAGYQELKTAPIAISHANIFRQTLALAPASQDIPPSYPQSLPPDESRGIMK